MHEETKKFQRSFVAKNYATFADNRKCCFQQPVSGKSHPKTKILSY